MRGGGAERVAMNLCMGIAERGYTVDLVLGRAEGPYLADTPESVRLVDLNVSRTLWSVPALIRYMRREKPAAVLSVMHYANLCAIVARSLAGCPAGLVVSEHNTISMELQKLPGFKSYCLAKLIRYCYRFSDAVVAVSNGVADDLSRVGDIPRNHIQVIYNPVITPGLREKASAPLTDAWLADSGPPVILAVGSLREQKGFDVLIKAFAEVRRTRAARLLILGEGVDRPQLEALIKELSLQNDVRMPGFVLNPYAYMARASLFVLSSNWEGLPTVLVEALFCGVPVIATDCHSGPREILGNGRFGRLVPVADKASLAAEIIAGLGMKSSVPECSWQPFRLQAAVDLYLSILLRA